MSALHCSMQVLTWAFSNWTKLDVVAFLPVVEESIVELSIIDAEVSGLYEPPVDRRPDFGVLRESLLAIHVNCTGCIETA